MIYPGRTCFALLSKIIEFYIGVNELQKGANCVIL